MFAPPNFLVSFTDFAAYSKAASTTISPQELEIAQLLVEKHLPPVTSISSLALLFGYSEQFIGTLEQRTHRYYRHFKIPKGRRFRNISTPRISLKVIQSWFGLHLSRAIRFQDHIHGFIPGRSTKTAASIHCGAEWLVSVDIKDFFSSIQATAVHAFLKKLGYPGAGAWLMARLCTLNGVLPQGAPSSPVLSNICIEDLDLQLESLALSLGLRLTRYADDITVSGKKDQFDPSLPDKIERILKEWGFQIAPHKTKTVQKPQALKLFGLLVDSDRPRLSRKYRHKLRMMEQLLGKVPLPEKRNVFLGHLSYAKSIESLQADG